MSDPKRPPPQITPELIERAASSPGQMIYAIDPYFDEVGDVPPWGIEGGWRVDDKGELNREFVRNPRYRPSPVARGFPQPSDPVDAAVQLAVAGYGPESAIVDALLAQDVFLESPDEGGLLVAEDERSEFLIVVTAESHLPKKEHPWQRARLGDLVEILPPNAALLVNPWSTVKVRLPIADVVATHYGQGR